MEEKDYLGETLRRAERGREEAYFRQLDQKLVAELRQKDAEELEGLIRAYTRLRCPKCGTPLGERTFQRVTVEECPGCGGLWLDKGELETLAGPQHAGWLQRFYEAFLLPHREEPPTHGPESSTKRG
jgi:Zn-finger nucleic acid-binding protein